MVGKKVSCDKMLLSCIFFMYFSGCVAEQKVLLPSKELPVSEIPEAWNKVALKQVKGPDQVLVPLKGSISVQLAQSPTYLLKDTLQRRLGKGKDREVSLNVEQVRYAVSLSGFGVGADFLLKRGEESKKISLEHTVDAPVGIASSKISDELLSRAVVDLTDMLLYNQEALQFLGGQPETPRDSALLSGFELGPVFPLESSTAEARASGRILWGNREVTGNLTATVMLGDSKGGIVSAFSRIGSLGAITRVGAGVGGMALDNSGAIVITVLAGWELGYHGVRHTDSGYVAWPGFTIVAVPQVFMMNAMMFTGGNLSTFLTMLFGGSVEFDVPIIMNLGITGGAFFGSGYWNYVGGGASSDGLMGFLWYPMGDIYFQTSLGKVSLGVAFQQLASTGGDVGSVFKNPTINLRFETAAGRGVAYTKSKIAVGDYTLKKEEKVMSVPRNIFREEDAVVVKMPRILDEDEKEDAE